MVECGAYWAFYSMWFCKEISGGVAYLIEPESENLEIGRRNFERNGFGGKFFQSWVGSHNGHDAQGRETTTLDAFAQNHGIGCIDILHADIQGAELDMLRGARSLLANHKISFLFISTHSAELHSCCESLLRRVNYDPFISILPSQTYSIDGVLVARNEAFKHIQFEHPSIRPQGMESRL
jgi:hypothetical protein